MRPPLHTRSPSFLHHHVHVRAIQLFVLRGAGEMVHAKENSKEVSSTGSGRALILWYFVIVFSTSHKGKWNVVFWKMGFIHLYQEPRTFCWSLTEHFCFAVSSVGQMTRSVLHTRGLHFPISDIKCHSSNQSREVWWFENLTASF